MTCKTTTETTTRKFIKQPSVSIEGVFSIEVLILNGIKASQLNSNKVKKGDEKVKILNILFMNH